MLRLRPGNKVRLTPGFLLLAAILLYLDQQVGLLAWAVLASVCHELGHIGAARLFGGRVGRLTLSATGAELTFRYPAALSYGAERVVALAGPLANLVIAGGAMLCDGYRLVLTSLAIGLFNLVPILPLDGGCFLHSLLCEWRNVSTADAVLAACAGVFIGVLAGVGLIAALHYANMVLLLLSGWLLVGTLRKNNIFSPK